MYLSKNVSLKLWGDERYLSPAGKSVNCLSALNFLEAAENVFVKAMQNW